MTGASPKSRSPPIATRHAAGPERAPQRLRRDALRRRLQHPHALTMFRPNSRNVESIFLFSRACRALKTRRKRRRREGLPASGSLTAANRASGPGISRRLRSFLQLPCMRCGLLPTAPPGLHGPPVRAVHRVLRPLRGRDGAQPSATRSDHGRLASPSTEPEIRTRSPPHDSSSRKSGARQPAVHARESANPWARGRRMPAQILTRPPHPAGTTERESPCLGNAVSRRPMEAIQPKLSRRSIEAWRFRAGTRFHPRNRSASKAWNPNVAPESMRSNPTYRRDIDLGTFTCTTIIPAIKQNVHKKMPRRTGKLGIKSASIHNMHTSFPQNYPAI